VVWQDGGVNFMNKPHMAGILASYGEAKRVLLDDLDKQKDAGNGAGVGMDGEAGISGKAAGCCGTSCFALLVNWQSCWCAW
jgi:hypothetical protein